MTETIKLMRLNRYLSQLGVCSKRQADRFIRQGHLLINGHVAQLGQKVSDLDCIELYGKPLESKESLPMYLLYHKPVGEVCTHLAEVEGNVMARLPFAEKLMFVGRLDKESEGLLFLTNQGGISQSFIAA